MYSNIAHRGKEKKMKSLQTLVLEEITQATTTNKTKFFQQGKAISGYIVEQMKNGKPSTLTEAQEKPNFCAFIGVYSWDCANDKIYRAYEIKMNGKKATGSHFFNDYHIYEACTITQAEEVRKNSPIFAVYHPLKKEMEERAQIIAQKRTQRAENRETLLEEKRYSYTDRSLRELMNAYSWSNYFNRLDIYNFSFNSLDRHEFDEVAHPEVVFKNVTFCPEANTRKAVFDFIVDKGGLFRLPYLVDIKNRAKQLARRKEEERKAKAKEEWQADTKRAERKTALELVDMLIGEITHETDKESPDQDFVENIADTLKRASALLCFNKWSCKGAWWDGYEEVKELVRFYHSFKGLKPACKHQYTYNAEINRYEMTEEYKKGFWGENFATTSNEVESV